MKEWRRRIRGVFRTGLTWAAAWSVGGTMIRIVTLEIIGGTLRGPDYSLVSALIALPFVFGVMGFIGGAAFSVVLGTAEGRRRFAEMSLPRFAFWGALGGLLLSMLMFPTGEGFSLANVIGTGVVTLMGAGSAAGSLALARRAHDRDLLESGEDVGLLEEESPDPST